LKRITLLLLIGVALSSGARADLAAGVAAYQAGDFASALKEFKPLAAKGNADAQVNLGFLYARGQGVAVDYKQAASWYRKAAEQGQADAQFNLGSLYYDGLGLAPSANSPQEICSCQPQAVNQLPGKTLGIT